MKKSSDAFTQARKEGRNYLLEPEAKIVCMEYGIPVTRFKVALTQDEAAKFADQIGYPIVLKIVSPDILHKFDVGGVMLNLQSSAEVKDAYNKILENIKRHKPDAKIVGILVQEMAPTATEVIVGSTKDPQFGPALMFGLGGIFVEILKDVTFRIAPITESDAKEMITEVKAYPILKGYRGQPPADVDAIVKILMSTSQLVMDHMEIKELDLNPIMVYEKGAKTVDARIILEWNTPNKFKTKHAQAAESPQIQEGITLPEQTERKIEELNLQLAAIKRERDELNNEAKAWAEKRNQLHEQTRVLQTEVQRLKQQRDETNLQVQVLKAAREKAKTQRKEKYEHIIKVREKIKTLAQNKPSTRLEDLEKEIQDLDWKIQTTSIPVKEEKTIVDRVRLLENQRAVYKQLQELTDKRLELQAEAKSLGTQAKLNHEKLSELAQQSQKFHEQLIEIIKNTKSLRQAADEAHQKHLEIRQKANQAHEKYVEIQQQIRVLKEEQAKREKEHHTKREQQLLEEATKKAQEKMKRGEKLTWQEFKLLTEHEEATEP